MHAKPGALGCHDESNVVCDQGVHIEPDCRREVEGIQRAQGLTGQETRFAVQAEGQIVDVDPGEDC